MMYKKEICQIRKKMDLTKVYTLYLLYNNLSSLKCLVGKYEPINLSKKKTIQRNQMEHFERSHRRLLKNNLNKIIGLDTVLSSVYICVLVRSTVAAALHWK